MTTLSLSQVVSLCVGVSGDPAKIGRAVGIAWLESGFRTDATNTNTDSRHTVDRGLFQINSFWHAEVSDAAAFDPKRATSAAFHISGGFVDWTQWATHVYLPGGRSENTTRGQQAARIVANARDEAKAQLAGEKGPSPLTAAVGAVGGAMVGGASAVGSAVSSIGIGDFLGKLASASTWLRVLQVVGGSAAVVAGGFILARSVVTAPLGDAASLAAHSTAAAL